MVTGVSGAGKSSLVQDTLFPAICGRLGKETPSGLPFDDLFGVDLSFFGSSVYAVILFGVAIPKGIPPFIVPDIAFADSKFTIITRHPVFTFNCPFHRSSLEQPSKIARNSLTFSIFSFSSSLLGS